MQRRGDSDGRMGIATCDPIMGKNPNHQSMSDADIACLKRTGMTQRDARVR